MRHPLRIPAPRIAAACLFGALAAPQLSAQVGLELELESGGGIGQNLIWSVSGQDAFSPLAKVLGVDFETVPGGLDLFPFGKLHLALSSSLLVLPGQENGFYSLAVPEVPGLQGLSLYAQALGPALGAPAGTLLLSNLVETELSSVPPVARLAHTLCLGDGTLHTSGIDGASGKPRSLGFVPAGALPIAMAASTDGRFVWVVDAASNEVRSFRVDAKSGRLSAGAVAPCDPGTNLIAIDPTAQVLMTGSSITDRVRTYRVDLATGAPAPSTVTSAPSVADPADIAFHALGEFAYVLSGGDEEIISLQIDLIGGSLNPISSAPAPSGANRLLTDAKSGFGVAFGQSSGEVRLFGIDSSSGTWSGLGPAPRVLNSGVGAAEIVEIEGVRYLYADEPASARLSIFRIDSTNGELLAEQSFVHGSAWSDLTWDGGTQRLVATDAAKNELLIFRLDDEGVLVQESSQRTRSTPIAVGLASGLVPLEFTTRSLFVAHEGSNELRAFQVLGPNALVLDQGGGVFPTQASPVAVALSPTGDMAVTSDFGGNGLTSFPANVTLGQLGTPKTTATSSPFDVQFDCSGRFLYATSAGSQSIEVFRRQSSSQLDFVGSTPLPAGSFPRGIALDPSGRFLFVACSLTGLIESFAVDSITGLLTPRGSSPVDGAPIDLTVSPDGRFLYSVQQNPGSLDAFAIDPSTGFLFELDDSPDFLATGAIAVEVDPCGRFLYAASTSSDKVTPFRLDPETGQPEKLAGSAASVTVPGGPRGLACDATGSFLFVSRNSANLIDSYAIDPATGSLSLVSTTNTVGSGPRGMAAAVELN